MPVGTTVRVQQSGHGQGNGQRFCSVSVLRDVTDLARSRRVDRIPVAARRLARSASTTRLPISGVDLFGHRGAGLEPALFWPGQLETVYSIALSPDGTRAATGSCNGQVGIWDAVRGKRCRGPFHFSTGCSRVTPACLRPRTGGKGRGAAAGRPDGIPGTGLARTVASGG